MRSARSRLTLVASANFICESSSEKKLAIGGANEGNMHRYERCNILDDDRGLSVSYNVSGDFPIVLVTFLVF